MGWNGSGGVTRTHNFSADGSAGIKILASRVDAEFNDQASAISLAVARDGQNAPTANLPMGGFKHTNVGAATSAENYVRVKEFIRDIPVYVKESGNNDTTVRASTSFYVSVSGGQSPPDGSRMRILVSAAKTTTTCSFFLFTPLNTSAGGAPHTSPVWSRGRKYDPQAMRADTVYDFVYEASASAWRIVNPSPGFKQVEAIAKVIDANGTVAGRDGTSVGVFISRNGPQLVYTVQTTASVSCSISGRYLVLSAHNISSMTSGVGSYHAVPIAVKGAVSHSWAGHIHQGSFGNKQLVSERVWNVDGTTVSAACTIQMAPFTAILIGNS